MKPENCLFDSKFDLKISDYGFAGPKEGYDGEKYLQTYCGTKNFIAPEIHIYEDKDGNKQYLGDKVDIFAAGVTLFIFRAGYPPFEIASPKDSHYLTLVKNPEEFWAAKINPKDGPFSNDFKLLF